jgi:hypothetical protein
MGWGLRKRINGSAGLHIKVRRSEIPETVVKDFLVKSYCINEGRLRQIIKTRTCSSRMEPIAAGDLNGTWVDVLHQRFYLLVFECETTVSQKFGLLSRFFSLTFDSVCHQFSTK